MMHNALAKTGAYEDLWCHLKSMEHAIKRVLDPNVTIEELDKDRLRALAEFLDQSITKASTMDLETLLSGGALLSSEMLMPNDIPHDILTDKLKQVTALSSWGGKKQGLSIKIGRLTKIIRSYLDDLSKTLISSPPKDEFEVLHAILTYLLNDPKLELHCWR